jgi:hypothetical protein
LPDASGIAFARSLQDTSWDQTALRYTLLSPDVGLLAASFIAGLGEGEVFQENDSQPYLGFLGRVEIAESTSLQFGWSNDKNYLQGSALYWVDHPRRREVSRGFSASRYAASLFLDGTHPKARGLRLALGWQRSVIKGPSLPPEYLTSPTEYAIDPTEALAESLGARSSLSRESIHLSGSYLILGTYLLSFHQADLKVDLGDSGSFLACDTLDSMGVCVGNAKPASSFRVRDLGYGIGKRTEDSWSLLLESYQQKYDQLYQTYHFAPGRDQRRPSFRLLQLRLDYRI